MKYFQWLGQISGVDFPQRHFKGQWWMCEGQLVSGWDENLVGVYSPDQVGIRSVDPSFDFGLAINGWPVASSKMRVCLEKLVPEAVQFLPFQLQVGKASETTTGYCVAQLLAMIDCLDRRQSIVENNWEPTNEFGAILEFVGHLS